MKKYFTHALFFAVAVSTRAQASTYDLPKADSMANFLSHASGCTWEKKGVAGFYSTVTSLPIQMSADNTKAIVSSDPDGWNFSGVVIHCEHYVGPNGFSGTVDVENFSCSMPPSHIAAVKNDPKRCLIEFANQGDELVKSGSESGWSDQRFNVIQDPNSSHSRSSH